MAGNLIENLQGIGGLVSGLGDAAKGIREAITGKAILDPSKQADLEMKIQEIVAKSQEIEASLALAQSKVNEVQAASTNLFIAGGRPLFFWIGGAVIIWVYILTPILQSFSISVPMINMGDLWPVITGILGLGTMRTYEKGKGVVNQH